MFLTRWDGITIETDLVVVSTIIEDTVYRSKKKPKLEFRLLKVSFSQWLPKSKKTVAVAGTSGKSTTSTMLSDFVDAGLEPIISGAGLTSIIKQGKIGNAYVGKGDWLIIEADEIDGSVVQYTEPEIFLNIDKDHQEIDRLLELHHFKNNANGLFIVNQSNILAKNFVRRMLKLISVLKMKLLVFNAKISNKRFSFEFWSIKSKIWNECQIGQSFCGKCNGRDCSCKSNRVDLKLAQKVYQNLEEFYRRQSNFGKKNGFGNWWLCAQSCKMCMSIKAVNLWQKK